VVRKLNTTLSLQQSEIANKKAGAANRLAKDAYTQTQYARKQNTVLMTFTVATIFFVSLPYRPTQQLRLIESFQLPLSFLSSLFALDAEAFSKTRSPMAKARSGGTAKTTQVIDKGRLGGHLGYRRSRTKLGDQELGTMTRSEGN
jgi:hypothetical protein